MTDSTNVAHRSRDKSDILLGDDYTPTTIDALLDKHLPADKKVIVKASTMSEGGQGIRFFDLAEQRHQFVDFLKKSNNIVVQEVFKQHPTLASIHPTSVNTIRLITFIVNNNAVVLSGILRMGINGSNVDNGTVGGIFCGINANGVLKPIAYDIKGNIYDGHPQSGDLSKVEIPSYGRCVQLAQQLAMRLTGVTSLASWDFSVDCDGNPVLIEVNLTYGSCLFHQMCNGPIFSDMTKEVIDEVARNSKWVGSRLVAML